MRQGGNGQIKRFFKKMEIAAPSLQELYSSRGAEHYRQKLLERVDRIMAGEIKSHVRVFRKGRSNSNDSVKSMEELAMSGSSLYSVRFGLGPLGITLTKDFNHEAVVSRVAAGSAGEKAGIQVGDYIRGVSGIFSEKYDEIMNMISSAARPFSLVLLRCSPYHSEKSSPSRQNSSSTCGDGLSQQVALRRTASDLTNEDLEAVTVATPGMKSLGLEMTVENADIKHIASFSFDHAEVRHDSAGEIRLEEPRPGADNGAQDEDLDNWVEEEALHVSSCEMSSSTFSLNILEEKVEAPRSGLTLTVTFDMVPLGLTLTANARGQAEVLKLKEGGKAFELGVMEGDIVTAIDHQAMHTYHDAICSLTTVKTPIRITFYRHQMVHRYHSEVTNGFNHGSKVGNRDDMWIVKKHLSFVDVPAGGRGGNNSAKLHQVGK
eukprot:gene25622-30942_t